MKKTIIILILIASAFFYGQTMGVSKEKLRHKQATQNLIDYGNNKRTSTWMSKINDSAIEIVMYKAKDFINNF